MVALFERFVLNGRQKRQVCGIRLNTAQSWTQKFLRQRISKGRALVGNFALEKNEDP